MVAEPTETSTAEVYTRLVENELDTRLAQQVAQGAGWKICSKWTRRWGERGASAQWSR